MIELLVFCVLTVAVIVVLARRPDLLDRFRVSEPRDAAPLTIVARKTFAPSIIASLCHLLGVLTILVGVVMLTNEAPLGFAVIAGSIFYFALGSGLQYVYDIRNLLNGRAKKLEAEDGDGPNA